MKQYPLSISDEPSYPYRGVMLDTARHYIRMQDIKRIVNGMQIARLNALHLHLTDSESFPLVLDSYPQISNAGSYSSQETYDQFSIAELVSYASQRGVTVIPEIDAPAHSRAWALSDDLQVLNSCFGYPPEQWSK